jgi:hypothetical protein
LSRFSPQPVFSRLATSLEERYQFAVPQIADRNNRASGNSGNLINIFADICLPVKMEKAPTCSNVLAPLYF